MSRTASSHSSTVNLAGTNSNDSKEPATFDGARLISQDDISSFLFASERVSADWTMCHTTPGITAWKKKHPETGLLMMRCEALISGGHSVEAVTRIIYDLDINKQWNDGFDEQYEICRADAINSVMFLKSKSPFFGIARRTLVQFRTQAYIDGASVIVYRDGSHPDHPAKDSLWEVRAHTIGVTGYVIRSMDDVQRRQHTYASNTPSPQSGSGMMSHLQQVMNELCLICGGAAMQPSSPSLAASPSSPRACTCASSTSTGAASNRTPRSISASHATDRDLSSTGTDHEDSDREQTDDALPPIHVHAATITNNTSNASSSTAAALLGGSGSKGSGVVRVCFQTCVDPRGSIPVSVVNWVASKHGPKWQASLQAACDRLDPIS